MEQTNVNKLRKKAVIELLLQAQKENQALKDELEQLKAKLADKEICIENAGTIAEAAFQMNGVLEAAQAAAQQYLDNVKTLTERQEADCMLKEKATAAKCIAQEQATFERCSFMKEEAEKACEEMERTTRLRCEQMEQTTAEKCEAQEKETVEKCQALIQKAEQDVEEKWDDLSARLEEFYRAHIGLKSLLTADAAIQRN